MRHCSNQPFGLFHRIFAAGLSPGGFRLELRLTLAALLLAAATLGGLVIAVAEAQEADGAITGLTLASDAPGTLVVSWDMPGPAPTDYRIDWAKSSESYQSYTVNEGHVYPAGSATTVAITDLEAGAEYKVRLRARYHDGEHADRPWSGPWAEARLVMVARPEPTPTPEPDEGEASLQPPAAPRGLVATAEPGGVRLSWDDPADATVTHYRIQRRLADAPEEEFVVRAFYGDSPITTYLDPAAGGLSYVYRVQAINAQGQGPPGEVPAETPPGRLRVALEAELEVGVKGDDNPTRGYGNWLKIGAWRVLRSDWGLNLNTVNTLVHQPHEERRVALVVTQLIDAPFILWLDGHPLPAANAERRIVNGYAYLWPEQCLDWPAGETVSVQIEVSAADDPRLGQLQDASLSGLELEGAQLEPAFDPDTLQYIAEADPGAGLVTVRAEAARAAACGLSISPDDSSAARPGWQVPAGPGDQVVTITVTAPDGVSERSYTVTILGDGAEGAGLRGLRVVGLPALDFRSDQERYQLPLPAGAREVEIEPVANTEDDTVNAFSVRAERFVVETRDPEQPVTVSERGDTLVFIRARSGDGRHEWQYRLRLRPPQPRSSQFGEGELADALAPILDPDQSSRRSGAGQQSSGEPRLTGLTIDGGAIAPDFDPETFSYAVAVGRDVSRLTVTPAVAGGARLLYQPPDADADTEGYQVSLDDQRRDASSETTITMTTVTIIVRSPDGRKLDSYQLRITRSSHDDDASLSSLGVGDAELSPTFSATVTQYAVTVIEDTLTVTPATTSAGANPVIMPPDADDSTDGHQVSLALGYTTVTITVTAEDGTTVQAYVLVVTRTLPPQAGFSQVSAGEGGVCFLRRDGTVECWDSTGLMECPHPMWSSCPGRKLRSPDGIFTEVTVGKWLACGVRPSGQVVCWSGRGHTNRYGLETESGALTENQGAGEIIAANHFWLSCRLESDRSVSCTASHTRPSTFPSGELRAGPYQAIGVARKVACGLRDDGRIRCWGHKADGTLITKLTPEPETTFTYISAYRESVCALRESNGSALCWRSRLDGSVAFTFSFAGPYSAFAVSNMGGNVCGIKPDGNMECFWRVDVNRANWIKPRLENPPNNGVPFTSVSMERFSQACGLRENGTVACWGVTDLNPSNDSPWRSSPLLLNLSLDGLSLTPGFGREVTAYIASVANSVTSTTVRPEVTNLFAAYVVTSDQDDTISDGQVDLAVGANVINVEVTSADATTTRTYTVTVTRAVP